MVAKSPLSPSLLLLSAYFFLLVLFPAIVRGAAADVVARDGNDNDDDDDDADDLSGLSVNNANPLKDGPAGCDCYLVTVDESRSGLGKDQVSQVVGAQDITNSDGDDGSDSAAGSNRNAPYKQRDVVTSDAVFVYNRIFDFRAIPVPDGYGADAWQTPAPKPKPARSRPGGATEPFWPQYQSVFNTSAFLDDWGVQDWGKKATAEFPVRMQNSAANVYVGQDRGSSSTYISLRTGRLAAFQSASEVESRQKNVLHASARVRFRVRGDPGAVAGLFTFADNTNEADIEILTRDDPLVWRFTNQPVLYPENSKDGSAGDEIPGASRAAANLPTWKDEWRTGRIDWLPNMVRYYVDGELVSENAHSVPSVPSGFVMNMWSDGGVWSGKMKEDDWANLDVAWVQLTFNVSGPVAGIEADSELRRREAQTECKKVCSIADDIENPSTPKPLSAAPASLVSHPALLSIALIVMAWLSF